MNYQEYFSVTFIMNEYIKLCYSGVIRLDFKHENYSKSKDADIALKYASMLIC